MLIFLFEGKGGDIRTQRSELVQGALDVSHKANTVFGSEGKGTEFVRHTFAMLIYSSNIVAHISDRNDEGLHIC